MKKNTWLNNVLAIIGCGVMVVVGIMMLSEYPTWIAVKNNSFDDYNEALVNNNYESIEDGNYSVTIDATFGCFATEGEGSSTSTWYYAIWLDDNSVVSLRTDDKDTADELERIADETWAYLNYEADSLTTEPLTLNVSANALAEDGTIATYYTQDLEAMGVSSSNFEIRNVSLSTSALEDIGTELVIGAIILLAGIICIFVMVRKMLAERKQRLWGFERGSASGMVSDMGTVRGSAVSIAEAKARIKNPLLKKSYKDLRRTAGICIILGMVLVAIPACMFLYNLYFSSKNAEDVSRYDLLDFDGIEAVSDNDAAELEIYSNPYMIYNYDSTNYYIVGDDYVFIAIMDGAQYQEAVEAIDNEGSYTLQGYVETPSRDIKTRLLEYFNDVAGYSIADDEFEDYFGPYMLHVEDEYIGSGFPIERIKTWFIVCGFLALFLLYVGVNTLFDAKRMLKRLSYLSNVDYEQMEKELENPSVQRYPQNLYMTENYIILLHSFSAFKNNTNKEDDCLFVKYVDITWMYPSNVTMYGKPTNIGVTVFNKTFGPCRILSLPSNDQNQWMIQQVFDRISRHNPAVVYGYSEENEKKMTV